MNALRIIVLSGGLVMAASLVQASPMGGGGRGWNLGDILAFDLNQDGKITRAEVRQLRSTHFDSADSNKDGNLTPDETANLPRLGGNRRSSHINCRMDKDHNGLLSKEEYTSFIPPFLQYLGLGSKEEFTLAEAYARMNAPGMGHNSPRPWSMGSNYPGMNNGGSGTMNMRNSGPGMMNNGGPGPMNMNSGGPGPMNMNSGGPGMMNMNSGGPGMMNMNSGGPGPMNLRNSGSGMMNNNRMDNGPGWGQNHGGRSW